MEIEEERKLDILLAQLQERYDALHKMRDRSMQFVLWILGLELGMGWLLLSDTMLTFPQRWLLVALLSFIGIVTWLFIRAIDRGFKTNRRVIIRIETALKFYEKGCYGMSDSILPPEFSREKTGWTAHFRMLYVLIIAVFLILVSLALTNPCEPKPSDFRPPADPNQVQTQEVIQK